MGGYASTRKRKKTWAMKVPPYLARKHAAFPWLWFPVFGGLRSLTVIASVFYFTGQGG